MTVKQLLRETDSAEITKWVAHFKAKAAKGEMKAKR